MCRSLGRLAAHLRLTAYAAASDSSPEQSPAAGDSR